MQMQKHKDADIFMSISIFVCAFCACEIVL